MQATIPSGAWEGEGAPPQSDLSATTPVRPKRRQIFLSAVGDLLLIGLALLVVVPLVALLHTIVAEPTLAVRTDRWRFHSMPSGGRLSPLQSWASSADGIEDFNVALVDGENRLVLRYTRRESLGPAKPPWHSWGYELPYLESSATATRTTSSNPPLLWIAIGLGMVAAGIAVRSRIAQARRDGTPIGALFTRPGPGWWRTTAVAFAFAFVALPALGRIFHLNGASYVPDIFRNLTGASAATKLAVLSGVGLIGPFVEEYFFRGLVYGRFRAYGYSLSGAGISAAMFTACHAGPPLYLGAIFVMGLVLAWLYQRTGSLWPPVAVHAVNNLLFVFSVIR